MNRKVVILVIFVLMAVGGKILQTKIVTTPASQLGSEASKLEQTGKIDVPTVSIKITDRLSRVIRVVDGDTIVVEVDGVQEKVRLIGVDTPEVVDSRKTVECFGKEASAFTTNLLTPTWKPRFQVGTNVRVRLESDSSQEDRDRYGRLLRYVFLADNTLVNKTIIAEGYGHEYTYRTPYLYQAEFKTAERIARENQKGLWAVGICS